MKKITTLLLIMAMLFSTFGLSFADAYVNLNTPENTDLITLDNGYQISEMELVEILNSSNKNVNLKSDSIVDAKAIRLSTYSSYGIPSYLDGEWKIVVAGLGTLTVIVVNNTIKMNNMIINAGSALYNSILSAVEKLFNTNYDTAVKDGAPTDNHAVVTGSSLPTTGEPNSSKDLYNEEGSLKQRRYYDKNGNADLDIDYQHGGTGHTFPHRHDWNNGVRGPAY